MKCQGPLAELARTSPACLAGRRSAPVCVCGRRKLFSGSSARRTVAVAGNCNIISIRTIISCVLQHSPAVTNGTTPPRKPPSALRRLRRGRPLLRSGTNPNGPAKLARIWTALFRFSSRSLEINYVFCGSSPRCAEPCQRPLQVHFNLV